MPTFSAITVERVVESNEKTKAKLKNKSLTERKGAPPRFGSPILYTTPKSTPIPYISRSFTASPYVINHKRRGPPPVIVEKVEVNDAPCQNGFLLGDRDRDCRDCDTQKGITENKIISDEIGINNEEIKETQQENKEIGAKSYNEKNINNIENREKKYLSVREDSAVAEKSKSVLIQDKGVNQELNVEIRTIGILGAEEVLNKQKYKKNKVNGDKIRADEETRIREGNGFKERDNENEVNGNENMAEEEIRIREENGVTEKSIVKEEMGVSQEFGVEIRKIDTEGFEGLLKGIKVKCDLADTELESPAEGRLKLDSNLRDFSPEGMMDGSVVSNDQDNVATALNMRKFPFSGLNKVKTINGQTEFCCVPENEICLKSSGDEVFRSSGDLDYTPRTNRSDFFDAEDDLPPEDDLGPSSRSYNSRTHAELDILRSKISMEIGRRIRVEEALSLLQNLWQEIIEKFTLSGVSLSSIEIDGNRMASFVDDVCGQLTIARTVANAVGRASIRAETEHEMKVQIDNKNTEISRLRDKFQYYELVNREMSQRNQEAIELARRRRRRLKKRQQWLWSSFAISIAIGATAVSLRHKFIHTEFK
ncbi:hypothetical protein SUGI_0232580 [Cryptomeria japonica]|uniref:uncharacterized protein LOC131048763 n=1 Tax=Cryptomeria japonica TaxID=3369 RepID=UPI002408A761|nr:uncharacterized protein LOC131048763 [Cryptomeria japonica]GLJ14398.1 hypothetical protein SUGI_0232580 [Cryptomeria japonica]